MIAKKRETFRIEIRRQETEEKFRQKRYNVQGMSGLNGVQLVNEIGICMTNGDQEGILKQLGLLVMHLSKGGDSERQYDWVGGLLMEPYISNELILQQVLLLSQQLCEQLDAEQFEQFVEQIDLVNMYTQILYDGMNYSVDLIELLFNNLEMISRKSLCCQAWLISWDIITVLNTMLPQLQLEYNDYCMISILGMIQSFLEGTSRVPFSKCTNIIIIINTICKKLRQMQYMNATFESDIQIEEGALAEIKTEVLIKLMTVIKYYSDKSGSTVNLCEHKSVWIVITTICFHQLLSLKLRRIAVTILDVILTSSNSMIIKVIEHQPDIYYNLIMLLDVHSDNSQESNKIRYHCTSALRSLFSVEDIKVLNNLHLNQIPVQFLHFHKQEKQPKIIYHQIESLFYILQYSHYQQIKSLIDNDLITITCTNLWDSVQTNNVGCIKQLLKILSAILQHSPKDDRIIPNLKQNNIIGLFESIQRLPQETLQHNDLKLKIATYNIRNTQDQYPKRREQLRATIQSLGADVIGLQEVTQSELDYLSGDYQQFFAPIQVQFPHSDPEFRIDGGAILVRKGIVVLKHEILHISPFRIAQRIELVNVHIINTHLHHVIEDHSIRYHQIQGVLAWLIPLLDQNMILMGDLNLTPASKEYSYLQEYFKSSYLLVNTVEPDVTFPTGLTGPFMDTDPANTLDYIWMRGQLMVCKCSLFGGEQIEKGVYASDHLGIVGEFEIQ